MRARALGAMTIVGALIACEPSASETPSPESASPSESAAASTIPSAAPSTPAAWSATGSFNQPGGFSFVFDIAEGPSTIVALGTQYDAPLPNLGPPPPHAGRVWLSADGIEWEDHTPAGLFAAVSLEHVIARPDGSFLAFGTAGPNDIEVWESADGDTWTPISSPFPAGKHLHDLSAGAQGYLAWVGDAGEQGGDLWFSADGVAWTATTPAIPPESIGAGDQGFVVARPGAALASSDGTSWIPASTAPAPSASTVFVAPVGGDWYVIESAFFAPSSALWFSANGLSWSPSGSMPLATIQVDTTTTCSEGVTALHGSTPWLIAATVLSYPCGEGGFQVHGTQRASVDGTSWTDLPFPSGVVGQTGSGSGVFAARVASTGRLILGGQSNGAATFWIGP